MIALTVVSETAKTLTVSWTPVPGASGYEFFTDGKRDSNSWNGTLGQVVFGKPDAGEHTYEVVAVGQLDTGSIAWPATPPPVKNLTIGLTADKTSGVVLTAPATAAKAKWARTSTKTSSDPEYSTLALTATFAGTAAKPWVDAIAVDVSGNDIGSWTGRIQTTQVTPPPTGKVRFGITNNVGGDQGANGPPVLALNAKLIREDTPAVLNSGWAKANGIDVIQIIYPGDVPHPDAIAHEVVANSRNEPYWGDVDPKAWAVACLAEVHRVAGYKLGKPIIIPLVTYGAVAGNNGMDGTAYPGQYAYPQPPDPYMANAASWVKTINAAAPGLLAAVQGFSAHPYFNTPAFHVLDTVRAELQAIPASKDKPFWITEAGMYSSADSSGDANQQTVIQNEIAAAKARTDVVAYLLYRLGQAVEDNAYWGILRADGSKRLAYAEYQAAVVTNP